MKNPMHDSRSESANSVAFNMKIPSKKVIKRDVYLNKIPENEYELDLTTVDLLNMSQITAE